MSNTNLQHWINLPPEKKKEVFHQVSLQKKIPAQAIEKDWWVVQTLKMLFTADCNEHLIFKGGTSLSKAWNVIERFSEDIDLVIDREFLGFSGELNTREIKNLRKKTKSYIVDVLTPALQLQFIEAGLKEVTVKARYFESSGQDPMIIEVFYPKLLEVNDYIKPDLLLEIGSRSLVEPYVFRDVTDFVSEMFAQENFTGEPIRLKTANLERTFLEKIFLLHEEFQKPTDKIRTERMSRHLYDIEKLMKIGEVVQAFENQRLYETILEHRRKYTPLQEVDYDKHTPSNIQFLPPKEMAKKWEKDYQQMQENMIYGDSLPFKDLMKNLQKLQNQMNQIVWN